MHTHSYTFTADTPKEMGRQVGETFRDEIQKALVSLQQSPKWESSRSTDQASFELTRQHFPEYVEELTGYAEGAGIPVMDAWSLCIEDESGAYEEENAEHCTSVITNGGLLIGHNEDSSTTRDQDKLSVVRKTLPTVSTFELYYATSIGGTAIGVNSHGYAQIINTLYHSNLQVGVPRVVISHFLLQTQDPEHDLALVSKIPKMSGYHHAIAKNTGEIWTVEFNSSDERVRKESHAYIHTNHCVFDPSKTFPDDWGTLTRYTRARELVREQMSREELERLLQDTSTAPKKIFNDWTMAQMIIDFKEHSAYVWLRREPEKGFVPYALP